MYFGKYIILYQYYSIVTSLPHCKMLLIGKLGDRGRKGIYENSILSPQYFCTPKTALKNEVLIF